MSIDFNVDAALLKLQQFAEAHGTQALDAAEQVTRVNALNELIGIPGFGLITAVCLIVTLKLIRNAKAVAGDDSYSDAAGWTIGAVLTGIATVTFFVLTMLCLCNVWAWVALFNPKLALAHKLMQAINISQ